MVSYGDEKVSNGKEGDVSRKDESQRMDFLEH